MKKYLTIVAALLMSTPIMAEIPQATPTNIVGLFATFLVLKGKCHTDPSPTAVQYIGLMAQAAGVDLHNPQIQAQIQLETIRMMDNVKTVDEAAFCKAAAEIMDRK